MGEAMKPLDTTMPALTLLPERLGPPVARMERTAGGRTQLEPPVRRLTLVLAAGERRDIGSLGLVKSIVLHCPVQFPGTPLQIQLGPTGDLIDCPSGGTMLRIKSGSGYRQLRFFNTGGAQTTVNVYLSADPDFDWAFS